MNAIIVILHFVFLVSICWSAWRRVDRSLKKYFWPGLLFKVACGLSVGFLYQYYYSEGDTFLYFQDGRVLSELARVDFFAYLDFLSTEPPGHALWSQLTYVQPRAAFFAKFVSVVNLLTFDNYWLTSCYFSLVSFAGAWILFRRLHLYFASSTLPAAIAFLFFPSVVFWTSGLIKESLACAALFFLSALFLVAWFEKRISVANTIMGLIALWVLWGLKYYYAAIFIPVVFTSLCYRYLVTPFAANAGIAKQMLIWALIFIVPLVVVSFLHPNFYPERFLEVIVSNNEAYREFSRPEDTILFDSLRANAGSILKNTPLAIFSGLFRPLMFEAHNGFQWMAAFENLMLLIIALFSVHTLFKKLRSGEGILIFAVFVYIILLTVFITLSTPNFGTLSRYRAGYIPYFVFIVLCGNPLVRFFERKYPDLAR
jgi:hypothetical protein